MAKFTTNQWQHKIRAKMRGLMFELRGETRLGYLPRGIFEMASRRSLFGAKLYSDAWDTGWLGLLRAYRTGRLPP